MDQFNLEDALKAMDGGYTGRTGLQLKMKRTTMSNRRRVCVEKASKMKFSAHSFLDDAVEHVYGEQKAAETEFTKKHDVPCSYQNLQKALHDYCPSMGIPPFAELRRYSARDKSVIVKRDDHMLALYLHHTSKVHKRRFVGHDVFRNILSCYNRLGSKMTPRKLKVAGVRATVKNLQMRDPGFSLAAQYRSRKDSVVCETRALLGRQPFMLCDEGCRRRTRPPVRGASCVRDAVVAEAERILAAVPAHSSVCNSTIARWAVWRISTLEGLGDMNPCDIPVNHPTHRAWLAPLGCVVQKKKQ